MLVKKSLDAITWSAATAPANSISIVGASQLAFNGASSMAVLTRNVGSDTSYIEATSDLSSWSVFQTLTNYGTANLWGNLYFDGYRYALTDTYGSSGNFYRKIYAPYFSSAAVVIGTVADSLYDFAQSPI